MMSYKCLGVSPDADAAAIDQAYWNQAVLNLPPPMVRTPDEIKEFERIAKAHAKLSNPVSRRQYDAQVHASVRNFESVIGARRRRVVQLGRKVMRARDTYLFCVKAAKVLKAQRSLPRGQRVAKRDYERARSDRDTAKLNLEALATWLEGTQNRVDEDEEILGNLLDEYNPLFVPRVCPSCVLAARPATPAE